MSEKKHRVEKTAARFAFDSIKSRYDHAVFTVTGNFDPATVYNAAYECVKCGEIFPLESCPNCGSQKYDPGVNSTGIAGIFCHKCEKGITSWSCPDCGTDNPVRATIGQLKSAGGCLIATAAYGGPNAPEVVELRRLRDQIIERTRWGKDFISRFNAHYYSFSPDIASRMTENKEMRDVIGWSLVTPLLNYLRLVADRPALSPDDLEGLDPNLARYIMLLWCDMDRWLEAIPIPVSYDDVDAKISLTEMALVLRLKMRSSADRLACIMSWRHDLVLPLVVDACRAAHLTDWLSELGITPDESALMIAESGS